ncbi:hypothetical protein [Sphaerisporangium rufum]|uniref:hypothetical protein n=1 Tax=Sphaerisporangium rufum TaxID=1381558 RepID=UPI0019524205|nr:hypothetical protein [Sphaerisporangium rufum]
MNVHWWIAGTSLLTLLAASVWPPWRAVLTRTRPHLFGGITEMAPDDGPEPYTMTSVSAGWCTTTLVMATWEQVAEHAARRSADADTSYVCVLRGTREWYWQQGRLTDAIASSGEDHHPPTLR